MVKRKVERFLMKLLIGVGIPFGAMMMHLKMEFFILSDFSYLLRSNYVSKL